MTAPTSVSTIAPSVKVGDTVRFVTGTANGIFQAARGLTGRVLLVLPDSPFVRAHVLFQRPDGSDLEMHDIPVAYLLRVEPTTSTDCAPAGGAQNAPTTARRPRLKLTHPRDERTEAQRMDAGLSWLRSLGYGVLRVGQGRAAAICHACSRQAGRLVQIHCVRCGSRGFAPSTNSTAGTPDSFVYREDYPVGTMLGMEWKDGPRGQRTTEQAQLEASGRIVVVWDEASMAEAVVCFEAAIGVTSHPDLIECALKAQPSERKEADTE